MTEIFYESGMNKQSGYTNEHGGFSLFWFAFLFTCIFPPMFLPVDVRLLICAFWMFMGNRAIKKEESSLVVWLLAISAYSIVVFIVNYLIGGTASIGIPLRFIRSLLMLMAIGSCLSAERATAEKKIILNTLELLLAVHSIVIIIEIIIPEMRDWLYIFAGKSRIFYQYRASGFVNSFDFAGFYCIVGAMLSCFLFFITQKKKHIMFMLLCIIASVFTSRLNMFICLLVLIFVGNKTRHIKNGKILKVIIRIMAITMCAIVVLMWAITTDAFTNIRSYLFSNYKWMSNFYSTIRYTYSDDSISQTMASQFSINGDSVFKIFGTGADPNRDPGYVQMLYGIGIVGTIITISPYLLMIIRCNNIEPKAKIKADISYYDALRAIFLFIIFYQFIMNAKILFLYSTGAFELCIIIYTLLEMYKQDFVNVNEGRTDE